MQVHLTAVDQALGTVHVAGQRGVTKGLEQVPGTLAPRTGPDVQLGDLLRRQVPLEPVPQQVAEELVIAVPVPFVVEGDDEQVGALDGRQRLLAGAGRGLEDGIAEWPAQAVEDGGAQQEGPDLGRLPLQDLLEQVVQHEAVAAGERADEPGRVGDPLDGDGRHLQAGDPALGAGVQRRDVLR